MVIFKKWFTHRNMLGGTLAILVFLLVTLSLAVLLVNAAPEGMPSEPQAGAPEIISYQGQVIVSNTPFNGSGYFKVVANLKVGELHPQVVEDRHSFMIVRLLSSQSATAIVEILAIPKLVFEPWFQTISQRIPLQINDPALIDALLVEVDVPYITNRLGDE